MKKKFMLFFISDFFMLFFIKKWCLTLENFFSASSRNFSIGRMKNPRSFLISNRGQRTRFHFEFLDLEPGRRKLLRISPRSESRYQSFAEVQYCIFKKMSTNQKDLKYVSGPLVLILYNICPISKTYQKVVSFSMSTRFLDFRELQM